MSLVLGTFVFSLAGGIVPFLNVEAYLFSVAALGPRTSVWPIAIAAALGQMAAKSLLYLAGRGLLRLPLRRMTERIRAATDRLARAERGGLAVVAVSSLTGLPPFYAISVAAGALRLHFARFFTLGLVGRTIRFAGVLVLPHLVQMLR